MPPLAYDVQWIFLAGLDASKNIEYPNSLVNEETLDTSRLVINRYVASNLIAADINADRAMAAREMTVEPVRLFNHKTIMLSLKNRLENSPLR